MFLRCATNIGAPFAPTHQKTHRMVVTMPPNNNPFQLPQQRSVSVQIPRQHTAQIQQRIVQSPFSPQSQTPQSPHNQFPLSPATNTDQYSRPSPECSQDPYLNVSILVVIWLNRFIE